MEPEGARYHKGCKHSNPSHFTVDATHSSQSCLDALADAVFCKHIQCVADEVSRTTLAPQRLIQVKIKTAFGSQIEVSVPRTATVQLIHSVWAIAARLTGIAPHIRTVVNARQIMPQVPFHQLTTCATGGKCTIHTLFPLRGGGLPQHCSLEGVDQLRDSWEVSAPHNRGVITVIRHHRLPRTLLYHPENPPPGVPFALLSSPPPNRNFEPWPEDENDDNPESEGSDFQIGESLLIDIPWHTCYEVLTTWNQLGVLCAFHQLDWTVHCDPASCMRLRIVPGPGCKSVVDTATLTDVIFHKMLECLGDASPDKVLRGAQVKIKSITKMTSVATLQPSILMDNAHEAWESASRWTKVSPTVRIIASARQAMPCTSIADLALDSNTIHLVRPLHGGGAKSNKIAMLKGTIAKWLLHEGVAYADLGVTDALYDKAGQAQLQVIADANHPDRWQKFISLMYKVDLPVPERTSAQDCRPKPRPGQARISPLDVSELILEPGCFVGENGQTLQAIHMIAPKMAGIVLLNASQASPWLQNTSELSADPLAALIPVNESISSPREYKIITVPVRDSCNQPILISARIYQLGRTEVKFQAASSGNIAADTEVQFTFQAYQDEFLEEEWKSIQAHPIREIRRILSNLNVEAPYTKVWGRSFMKNGQETMPDSADSIAFQATISQQHEMALLQISGIKGVCATSREGDGRPRGAFRIVWASSLDLRMNLSPW